MIENALNVDELAKGDRFEALCAMVGEAHAPLDMSSPHADDFHCAFRLLQLGPAAVWVTELAPMVFRRTPRLIRRSDPELCHLSFMTQGNLGFECQGRESTYGPYEWRPNDSSVPYTVQLGEGCTHGIALEIPKALIPLPAGRADRLIGGRLTAREGIGALLADLLLGIVSRPETYTHDDGPRLGTIVTDLVAALFAHALDAEENLPPETRRRGLVLAIERFVQMNLADPDLTPGSVAAAHHISVGHLHRLFQERGLSVAADIRRRRLEGIRHDLADPARSRLSIAEIAARWGVHNPSVLSRQFRAAYGMSPRDQRRLAPSG
ncbi:helix-turn-helix domain-containing protein [Streptomyces sp. NPDC005573]|uniref:AraC-like ligand-binding domain-containing protein n=1 Tax=Streptomyces sp. NPDC005573 TaxID=3156890 RepID=UPI0033B14D79